MPVPIGHLDADCFYVSAERVRHAFLRGKPVGVLGNQGACVIAKSYELKAAGVRTGEPIWDALVKCPQAVFVKRDFRWYEVLSRRMLEVVREFSPRVEYYSIDEFFFEAVPLRGRTLQQTAEALRDRIWEVVRVPVTVGIARSRTLAKLISDTAKPFGALALLGAEVEWPLLDRTAVTEVSGIGSRRGEMLNRKGIFTALDLALADRRLIRQLLTVVGEGIWYELNGESILPLCVTRPPHKTLARGGSLGRATADPAVIWGWLVRSLERLIEELEYHGVRAGLIEVALCYREGHSRVGRGSLTAPTDRFDLLLEAVRAGYQQAFCAGEVVTRGHVIASRLAYRGLQQQGLFEPPAERAEALARVKREINSRIRRFALRSGATLWLGDLYRDEAAGYDVCDVRGKICF